MVNSGGSAGSADGGPNGDDGVATVAVDVPKLKPFCGGRPALVAAGDAGWLPVKVNGLDGVVTVVGVAVPPNVKPELAA